METEIKFNLPRQGRSKAQQHFLREILLDKSSIISDDYLARPTTYAARRDLYQICYTVAFLLLLDNGPLIDQRMAFYNMPLSRFLSAVDFFSDKEIDSTILSARPSTLAIGSLLWFAYMHYCIWHSSSHL